jgi:hypothetical protein
VAIRSVTSSVKDLAGQAGLDQDKVNQLKSIRNKDPNVEGLFMLEAIAEILAELSTAGQVQDIGPKKKKKEAADLVLAEVDGLTKTSQAAIKEWASGAEAQK